jgi:hypothetical protein
MKLGIKRNLEKRQFLKRVLAFSQNPTLNFAQNNQYWHELGFKNLSE